MEKLNKTILTFAFYPHGALLICNFYHELIHEFTQAMKNDNIPKLTVEVVFIIFLITPYVLSGKQKTEKERGCPAAITSSSHSLKAFSI